jgi:hypothetical protein
MFCSKATGTSTPGLMQRPLLGKTHTSKLAMLLLLPYAFPLSLGLVPTHLSQAVIFASIGLTALHLPNMDAVHWSARAACASSMVLGVVSVITATRARQTVGMLKSPLEIRPCLSRGRPTRYFGIQPVRLGEKQGRIEKYAFLEGFHQLHLESSVSALKEIAFPRHPLSLAVPHRLRTVCATFLLRQH